MKHRFFTLVELLTVIAVIAILAGIAVPVVIGMQSKGKEMSARADMNAIKMALTQFKADYSVWPQVVSPSSTLILSVKDAGDTEKDKSLVINTPFEPSSSLSDAETAYDNLTEALTYNKVDSTSPDAPSSNYGNTKKKRYLDPPAKPVKTKNPKSGDFLTGYYKLDPWGRRYNIALDWNYNGKIEFNSSHKFAGESAAVLGQILIYSYGTAEDTDDIDGFLCSWKTNAK